MRRLLLATSLFLGCAHGADRAPIVPTAPADLAATPPVPIVWRKVRLDSAVQYANVDVSIGGYTVPFVLDTGANGHLIVAGLAWYLGLRASDGGVEIPVQGAHGEEVGTSTIDAVPYHLLHWPAVAPTSFLVADMPVRSRLMGFLSPQLLVGEGAATIDLRAGRMEPVPRSALDAAAARAGAVRAVPVCPRASGVAIFDVDVDVEGHRVPMTVDTGSGATTLFGQTDVGRALLPRARGPSEASAALDGVERTSTVPDVKLAVAGLEMRTTVSVIDRPPPDHCSGRPDVARTTVGAIGIDVLRRCVIVIASNDAVLRCE